MTRAHAVLDSTFLGKVSVRSEVFVFTREQELAWYAGVVSILKVLVITRDLI